MLTKDWQQVEAIFDSASNLPTSERPSYLQTACGNDSSLRAEVDSLLKAFDDRPDLMEEPAFEFGLKIMSADQAASMIGLEIGGYNILKPLGKGGMGEVYLADDLRLGRKVALKFLSPEFVGDNWAKRQLIKEAQSVAMLDHPNICQVYDIEEHDGHSFIVMQYLEGATLAEMIRERTLASDRIIPLAQQIVGALAEAHAHGIIHRDIKPGNIMVTTFGQAKVLDFGLAKVVKPALNGAAPAESVSHLTLAGMVPGTVAYMSPEQLRAETLDFRSDIFSLGTVLYEMVKGANPFSRATGVETISAILTTAPVFEKSFAPASPGLGQIVQKCLQKEKSDRYQSAGDLLTALDQGCRTRSWRDTMSKYLTVRAAATLALLSLLVIVAVLIYFQASRVKKVAVFPITNASGDQSIDYLTEGITDSVTRKLSGLSKLRTVPNSLVAGYKGSSDDPVKIGRNLGVDAVVVSNISGGSELRVLSVTLLSTVDGSTLWEAQYPIDLGKVYSIDLDIAEKIVTNLEFRSGNDAAKIRANRVVRPEAVEKYWRGQFRYSHRKGDDTLKEAIEQFNAAIELDPAYAQPFAGLANCYILSNVVTFGHMKTKEAMDKAAAMANRALDLDSSLPEAQTALGVVNLKYYWKWPEAEKHLQKAIELNPEYAPAHEVYSSVLIMMGHDEQAREEIQRALQLDPFSEETARIACKTLYFTHHYSEAMGCFDKLINDFPTFRNGQYSRGLLYLQQNKSDQALKIFEDIYGSDKKLAGAALGYTYGILGRTSDAKRVLADLKALKDSDSLPPQEFGLIYLGLGDIDKAIDLLQQGANEHFPPFRTLGIDPLFAKLHANPRFRALMQQYNLPLADTGT
jgi:serine/threonine-protein kinase